MSKASFVTKRRHTFIHSMLRFAFQKDILSEYLNQLVISENNELNTVCLLNIGLIRVLQVKLFIHTEYAIKNHIQYESNFYRDFIFPFPHF